MGEAAAVSSGVAGSSTVSVVKVSVPSDARLTSAELGEGAPVVLEPPKKNGWIKPLWLLLAVATAVAVGSVIAIAVPNLTGSDPKQLDLMWKIAATIGAAAGGVLGWIVRDEAASQLAYQKHLSDIELTRYRAILDSDQRKVDSSTSLDNKSIETIIAGHVQLAVQGKLNEQRIANEAELERNKRELELQFNRKNLALEEEFASAKSQRAPLEILSAAIVKVQAAFKSLTTSGPGVSKEDLDKRIDAALSAKTELEIARKAVKQAIQILPDGFSKLAKALDKVLLGIIKQVREAPNIDELDEDDLFTLNREYERIGKPAMQKYAAHLQTITNYLNITIEYRLNPALFFELRVEQERNLHARALVKFLRKQNPSFQTPKSRQGLEVDTVVRQNQPG
jgi:hypothetical protein